MFVLRFYLIIAGLALVLSLLLGVLLRDRRWFRFAWQLFKFSLILLLIALGSAAIGRLLLL